MKFQKILLVLAVLTTVAANIGTAEAGKRSGGSRSGGRSSGRSISSMRSSGLKAASSFRSGGSGSKKSSFSSSNMNRRTLTNQFQKKVTATQTRTQPRTIARSLTSARTLTKAKSQPQLRIQQGLKQHVTNHVQNHIKHRLNHQTHNNKCAPIKVCHPPKHVHCHKVWWHSWIKPCVKPVVIPCPVVVPTPVPVPVPVPVPTPVVEPPAEPVAPIETELPRSEVEVGSQIVLDGAGFGSEAGQIRIRVAGLNLIAPIVEWKDTGVILGIPPMDMTAPTDAELIVLHADGTTLQTLPITMMPAAS